MAKSDLEKALERNESPFTMALDFRKPPRVTGKDVKQISRKPIFTLRRKSGKIVGGLRLKGTNKFPRGTHVIAKTGTRANQLGRVVGSRSNPIGRDQLIVKYGDGNVVIEPPFIFKKAPTVKEVNGKRSKTPSQRGFDRS